MNESYRSLINSKTTYRIAIVGKDPFPTNATGVPFCKPTWQEQLQQNSSGFHVLNSIGVIDLIDECKFLRPFDFFSFLASKGIVFLNISYEYIGGSIRRLEHRVQMNQAYLINQPIMHSCDIVLLCGEASKNRWNGFMHPNIIEVVHPDNRNRISRFERIRNQWSENWVTNVIKEKFELIT